MKFVITQNELIEELDLALQNYAIKEKWEDDFKTEFKKYISRKKTQLVKKFTIEHVMTTEEPAVSKFIYHNNGDYFLETEEMLFYEILS